MYLDILAKRTRKLNSAPFCSYRSRKRDCWICPNCISRTIAPTRGSFVVTNELFFCTLVTADYFRGHSSLGFLYFWQLSVFKELLSAFTLPPNADIGIVIISNDTARQIIYFVIWHIIIALFIYFFQGRTASRPLRTPRRLAKSNTKAREMKRMCRLIAQAIMPGKLWRSENEFLPKNAYSASFRFWWSGW